jgi:hypothetical protein
VKPRVSAPQPCLRRARLDRSTTLVCLALVLVLALAMLAARIVSLW